MLQKEGVELVNKIEDFKVEIVSQMADQKLKLKSHGKKIMKMLKKSWQPKKLQKQEKFQEKPQENTRE